MTGQTGMFVARDAGGNGTTPVGARQALAGLLAKNADGTVKVGVLADGQGPVVTGAAGMSYSVRKHVAVTKVSEANGPVLVPNDGTLSLTTDPAPGSNSRIDVIWVRQHHVTGDGGSDTDVTPEYGVTKGASNASPSKPAIPTGATELGSVPVPSGTTATSGLTFTQGPIVHAGGVESEPATLTYSAGWSASGGGSSQYVKRNGMVTLKVGATRPDAWGANSPILVVPAGFRPLFDMDWAASWGTLNKQVRLTAAGTFYAVSAGSGSEGVATVITYPAAD